MLINFVQNYSGYTNQYNTRNLPVSFKSGGVICADPVYYQMQLSYEHEKENQI